MVDTTGMKLKTTVVAFLPAHRNIPPLTSTLPVTKANVPLNVADTSGRVCHMPYGWSEGMENTHLIFHTFTDGILSITRFMKPDNLIKVYLLSLFFHVSLLILN